MPLVNEIWALWGVRVGLRASSQSLGMMPLPLRKLGVRRMGLQSGAARVRVSSWIVIFGVGIGGFEIKK